MLPGYLWQMPLYWGRCLRPIHGCCGMRLPRRFWPALPKPFGSSVVSPLPITSSPKIPNLVYKNGLDVWDSDNHRLQRPRGYLRAVAAGLLHPSPARLPLLLSPSSLSSVPGSSRADLFGEWGKHQVIFVSCWVWTCFMLDDFGTLCWLYLHHTCTSCSLCTSLAPNKDWGEPFVSVFSKVCPLRSIIDAATLL